MDNRIRETIRKLQEEIDFHRRRYYVLDDPVITDQEFDTLHQLFLDYQKKYPELVDSVGYMIGNYTHKNRMLSLKSTKEQLDIGATFVNYLGKISCEPKLDGLSVELVYDHGFLIAASTRGDGFIGEDITHNVRLMNIPLQIEQLTPIEIYGEIFLSKESFAEINEKRRLSEKGRYSSPRNAASGIIRSNEFKMFIPMLSFFPYTLVGTECTTQKECFKWLHTNGFNVLSSLVKTANDFNEVLEYVATMIDQRNNISFEIDGLVFKTEDLAYRKQVGEGFTHPNWAVAYKFTSPSVTTRIEDVVFQVGKSGIIAPVAILKPVRLHNSMVSRASLSNKAIVELKDIRIEDTVVVEMANDVIPYIAEVVKEDRTGKEVLIVFPTHCPSCESELKEIGPHVVCTNSHCPVQKKGRLVAAVSRKGFNIKGLGKILINDLVNNNIIWDISHVFLLPKVERILREELHLGEKTIANLFTEIKAAKNIAFSKFIYALGIPDVSTATAVKLANAYNNIKQLIKDANQGALSVLPGVSSGTYTNIIEYFSNPIGAGIVKALLDNGVKIRYDHSETSYKGDVVVTGKLDIERSELASRLVSHGYNLLASVSRKSHVLICGDNPSEAKIEKAKKYGIRVLVKDVDFKTVDDIFECLD